MLNISREDLIDLYDRYSTEQIAKILKTSRVSIYRAMKKYKIAARSYADASSFMNNQRIIVFTKQQEQLVYGSLLGDACLHWSIMKSNKTDNQFETLKLHFAHCIDQLPYLEYKRSILPGCKIGERTSGHGSIIKHYAFCHTPTLRNVALICHNQNHHKYVTKEWLSKIDWEGIAYWYQDDGSLVVRNGHPIIKFHTNSFSLKELDLLQQFLYNNGLATRLEPQSISSNNVPNISIASRYGHEAMAFIYRMSPFVIPHFTYKIRVLHGDESVRFLIPRNRKLGSDKFVPIQLPLG